MKKRIAFVNHRYGLEVTGGSELHCRVLAEKLKDIYNVTVITTCAIDDSSWANHYPEGEQYIEDIHVIRFPVEHERKWEHYADYERLVKDDEHMFEDEVQWIMDQGPYSPQLFRYIHECYKEYDAVIFMTYLYYTSAICILGIPNALFLPTAHDEIPLYMAHYRKVFEQPQGFIFNTDEERELIYKVFPFTKTKMFVTGCFGIDMPDLDVHVDVQEKYGLSKEYILYAGRITEAKGCDVLFSNFIKYKAETKNELELVLIGKKDMDIPDREDVKFLGFVSDEEKMSLMKKARLFCLASHFESLSIVVLEALACKTPILVTSKCEVLKGHVHKSNAGYCFDGYNDFKNAIDRSLTDDLLYHTMAENGRKYVETNYSWNNIITNLCEIIEKVHFSRSDISTKVENDIYINRTLLPKYNNNNIPVVFASDNNYVIILAVALQSLIDNTSEENNYDVCIMSDEILENNKDILRNVVGAKRNISLRFIEVASILDKQKFKINNTQLSRATFIRLLIPKIFSRYNKLVYLDCDVVLRKDVAQLFSVDLGNAYIGGVPDAHIKEVFKYRKSMNEYIRNIIGIDDAKNYFNAGVMVLNITELAKIYTTDKLLALATSRKWKWEDQDVLNYISRGHVKYLELNWDVLWSECPRCQQIMIADPDYLEALKNPYIIHYAAGMLPTKVENNRYAVDFWNVARRTPCYESIIHTALINYSEKVVTTKNDSKQNVLIRKTRSLCWRIRNQGIKETWIYAKKYVRNRI